MKYEINMNYGFDRLIVSSDDSHFLQFAPIISKAWRSLFPGLKLTIVYVSDIQNEKTINYLQSLFNDVISFRNVAGVPPANLAKIARRFACTLYDNEICMIEDIDTAPLRSDYVISYANQRKINTLGMVGIEVYKGSAHYGKVPASNSVAESHVWKKILNPKNLEFVEWVNSLRGTKVFDDYEDPYSKSNSFSDESLMRALLKINYIDDESITHIERNCDPKKDWIDRSWWYINPVRLQRNEYTLVNFKRPIGPEADLVVAHIYNM